MFLAVKFYSRASNQFPMPRFFDVHTHVQFHAFAGDRREVIQRALQAGVWFINIGTQIDTSRVAVEIAREYPEGVYAAVGLHPIHTSKSFHDAKELGDTPEAKGFVSRGEEFDCRRYRELAMDPKTVAIGECGLDYYHLEDEAAKRKQKEAFLEQIRLAKETDKPLMIHCREAFSDLIDMLYASRSLLRSSPGAVHFFTGTAEDARKLLDMGFVFTFGGAITFPPKTTRLPAGMDWSQTNTRRVIKTLPLSAILSETDAPYVSPVPYRGRRNEPVYVVEVVRKLAEIKGTALEEMAEATFNNAKRVFGI